MTTSTAPAQGEGAGTAAAHPLIAGSRLYLVARQGDILYGIDVLRVEDIITEPELVEARCVPHFVRGHLHSRGHVFPVVDLRLRLGIASKADTEATAVVVIQVDYAGKRVSIGVMVNDVGDVVDLAPAEIEPLPASAAKEDPAAPLLGMAKTGDWTLWLLDVDKLMLDEATVLAVNASGTNGR